MNQYLGERKIDVVIANDGKIDDDMAKRYESLEQKDPVELDREETPISATQVREAILNDNFNTFSDLVPNGLLLKFKWMNKVLKEIENDEH